MTVFFTSGPKSDKPRSDLRVRYTVSKESLKIEISSKVEALFSEAIRSQVESICRDLSVNTGLLEIDDFGALPFVIAARVEAVLKEAYPEIKAEALPDQKEFCTYGTRRDRFRRSRLYLPGNQPKLMLNAGIHRPDGIILDLEDSVSFEEKFVARLIVRNALRSLDFFGAERMVRINQGERGLEDLEFIVAHNVHLILIPKVESAEDVQRVEERVKKISQQCGRKEPVYFMPIIESGRGVMKALEIAEASENNVALTIGLEDYTASIGAERTEEGWESFVARSTIVNAAKAAGLQAIDTVFSDVSDEAGLISATLEAKSLGFDGKGCVHPRQIRGIHDAFSPSLSEVAKAKRIILAFDDAEAKGLGVVSLDSKMIDPPVVKRAMSVVEMAVSIGILDKQWKENEDV
ncbi:MAG: citrate lyase subunit beta/citryl-CoA lyase [Chlamydiales bacterium]|jgi:citrate lyase subunit beta/citryl-CoA lyase